MFNKERHICWLNVTEINKMHSTRFIKIIEERNSNNYKNVKLKLLKSNAAIRYKYFVR